jgi:hypothetical protein
LRFAVDGFALLPGPKLNREQLEHFLQASGEW